MSRKYSKVKEDLVTKESGRKIRELLYLSVAYAANTGGVCARLFLFIFKKAKGDRILFSFLKVGTLTGTGPNLVLKGMVGSLFGSSTPLNFARWHLALFFFLWALYPPPQLDGLCLAHRPCQLVHLLALAPELLPWPSQQEVLDYPELI